MTIQRRDGTIAKNWLLTAVPVDTIEEVREAAFNVRLTMRDWVIDAINAQLELEKETKATK